MRKFFYFSLILMLLFSCKRDPVPKGLDLRTEMRLFVERIATAARFLDPGFIVIPQNGAELLVEGMDPSSAAATDYLAAIDGVGQEGLFYGYSTVDQASPTSETATLRGLLSVAVSNGLSVLSTDYCSTPALVDDAFVQNQAAGYLSFAADSRSLNRIPAYPTAPHNANADDVIGLDEAQNFLYLLDQENFASRRDFIDAVAATNYDLVIMDLFFKDGSAFTTAEIDELHTKANGRRRLLISYLNIGEVEDSRFYWENDWRKGRPVFIGNKDKDKKGSYKAHYWDLNWQDVIYRGENSYLRRVLTAGFDGIYLDKVDVFAYFENL